MNQEQLRNLHARMLARREAEAVSGLPTRLRKIAVACAKEYFETAEVSVHEDLPDQDVERISAALSEQRRQSIEIAETHELCSRGDEAALRAMHPGRATFYDMVSSPPVFEEQFADAVVVIEIGAGSLVSKAKRLLESEAVKEGLKVQYGGSPNKHSKRFNTDRFFMGYYTPEIETRLSISRPDCKNVGTSRNAQAACRRDITISIVRDWLKVRGHRSVRFLLSNQSSWPHYEMLSKQLLKEYDVCIDTRFDKRLSGNTSFLREMCVRQRGPGIWTDYEAYVNALLPTG